MRLEDQLKNPLSDAEIDYLLQMDIHLFGNSYEYLSNGKRYRIDPRFIKRSWIKSDVKGGKSPIEK